MPKKLLLLPVLVLAAYAQNLPYYPNNDITINQLGIATDNFTTSLTNAISQSATTIPVAVASAPAPLLLYLGSGIGTEQVFCITRTSSPASYSNCTREFNNTTAHQWAFGTKVSNGVSAYQVNQLIAEVISIEANGGGGGGGGVGTCPSSPQEYVIQVTGGAPVCAQVSYTQLSNQPASLPPSGSAGGALAGSDPIRRLQLLQLPVQLQRSHSIAPALLPAEQEPHLQISEVWEHLTREVQELT